MVEFTFLVTNTGDLTVHSLEIVDPMPGLSAIECPARVLGPRDSTECTASYVLTQADVDAGSFSNTATVTGIDPSGETVGPATSTAVVDTDPRPAVTLSKTASPSVVNRVGAVVTYSFVVTNSGNTTLTTIAIEDPIDGLSPVVCPTSSLAPGDSVTCMATRSATEADLGNGEIVNTAVATGTDGLGASSTSEPSTATVTALGRSTLDVEKTVISPDAAALSSKVGDVLRYQILVTNSGPAPLSSVAVDDPTAEIISCTPALPAALEPGESVTCVAEHELTQADIDRGSVTNVATATGTSPGGSTETGVSGTVMTPLVQELRLDAEKRALTQAFTQAGDRLVYEIVATNSGNVTASGVVIEDPIATVESCSPAMPAVLEPGSSLTCRVAHVVTEADAEAGAVDNVATVQGNGPATCPIDDESDSCTLPIIDDVDVASNLVTVERVDQPAPSTTALPSTAPPTTAPPTTAEPVPTSGPPTSGPAPTTTEPVPTTRATTTTSVPEQLASVPTNDRPDMAVTGASIAGVIAMGLSMLVAGFLLLAWRRRLRR